MKGTSRPLYQSSSEEMRRPSVLFLNRVYPPVHGATGRMLRDLARSFAREGWHVTVITTGPSARKERDGAVRILRVKASPGIRHPLVYMLVWIKMLLAALGQPRHDLTVSMTDPPLLVVAGRIVSAAKKSKHMHWCQDLYPDILPALGLNLPGWLMRFLKKISRRAMRKCDKIVVIGRCMARQITHNGLIPGRVAVIPNWPDYEIAHSSPKLRKKGQRGDQGTLNGHAPKGARSFRELLKDDGRPKFRVLYSGNMGKAHPFHTILKAAELLDKQYPDIEFVFVGNGPNYERMARERAKRGLQNIRFLPYQPPGRLRDMMESGDLHLITMRNTAAGMLVPSKLYSALAVQRPCILVGPRNTETARVIEDFHAGTVVPEGDARALAEAIRAYRLNSDKWFLAHKGAAEAGKIFVPAQSIDAWLARAHDVVNVQRRRRRAA